MLLFSILSKQSLCTAAFESMYVYDYVILTGTD